MASDWQTFFSNSQPPQEYGQKLELMQAFVGSHMKEGRNIVLVSSGGTTVPLESRTVRFIDNFSVGTRGSASTEYFLKRGYAVLFLHRRGSLSPFHRHFVNYDFLNMIQETAGNIAVKPEFVPKVCGALALHSKVQEEGRLLTIDFTTLSDYLFLLKGAAQVLQACGPSAMFYLAAAVSDFYIPAQDMPEHKIQSADGPLQVSLQLVPKMLNPLISQWASQTFVVSFKLETDPSILIRKARGALEKYKHQIVVGNILETRKTEVILVAPTTEHPITMTTDEIGAGLEIEEKIVEALSAKHNEYKDKQCMH